MTGRAQHIPSFPAAFGEDQQFLDHYDAIQNELDDKMVGRLKENLDGLLTFAGLFAGVNSAFIALTLVLVQSNPLNDVTTLLEQLIQGLTSLPSLPSMSFNPSHGALITNGLFILSLSSAIFASFFAVLGKQWVMFYRNTDGGGAEQQRWEQLRRSLGAERWYLTTVLEVTLPMFIQASLVIFSLGLVLFLKSMSHPLSDFILVPLIFAIFASLLTVGFSIWDGSCPFRNPLSEVVRRIPLWAWRISQLAWWIQLFVLKSPLVLWRSPLVGAVTSRKHSQAKPQGSRFPRVLWEWVKKLWDCCGPRTRTGKQQADRNGGADKREEDKVVASGVYILYDEEKGNAWFHAKALSVSESPVPRDAGHHRFAIGQERWKSAMRMSRDVMTSTEGGLRALLQRFSWLVREAETERFLQVESIMRVIRISKDLDVLYTAALSLRSITDLDLLAVVCANETTTRVLRQCYSEALEKLDNKHPSAEKQDPKSLRHALAFGTACLHISLSAPSFDDFIITMRTGGVLPPSGLSDMSSEDSRKAGDTCRLAEASVRGFISLQLRRLGAQPTALTSTTLAATALWYAINGIPHSQDIVYGDRFRQALVDSQVSWACLGLLASVSNTTCQFQDVRKRKPFGKKELDWCREAFLRVRDAYCLSKPTQDLADAIRNSFTTGKNLETNAVLFKFTWKLFAKNDDGDPTFIKLGEHALSAGTFLICAIEASIRSSKTKAEYQKYADTRSICFNAMIEHLGPIKGETKALKAAVWKKKLTLMMATAYMEYIINLKELDNEGENGHAEEFMGKIREGQIHSLRTVLAMGTEYADAKHAFEAVYSKFRLQDDGVSVMSGDRIELFKSGSAVSVINPLNNLLP